MWWEHLLLQPWLRRIEESLQHIVCLCWLWSDNSPCFSSQEFKMFMKNNGIWHIFTAPITHPQMGRRKQCVHVQGSTEKDGSRQESNTWVQGKQIFVYVQDHPQHCHRDSQAELMFKRQLRTAFHLLKPDTYQVIGYKNRMEQERKSGHPFQNSRSMIRCCYTIWIRSVVDRRYI